MVLNFCPFTITTVAFCVLIPVSLVDSLLWRSHINQLTYYYSIMWAYPVRIYVLCGYFSYHLDISRNILAYNRSISVHVTISYNSYQLHVLPHINIPIQQRGHKGVPIRSSPIPEYMIIVGVSVPIKGVSSRLEFWAYHKKIESLTARLRVAYLLSLYAVEIQS